MEQKKRGAGVRRDWLAHILRLNPLSVFLPHFGTIQIKLMINDKENPYNTSELICKKCDSKWIVARPKGTLVKILECTNCSQRFISEIE